MKQPHTTAIMVSRCPLQKHSAHGAVYLPFIEGCALTGTCALFTDPHNPLSHPRRGSALIFYFLIFFLSVIPTPMASAPATGTMLSGVFVATGVGDVSGATDAITGVLSGVMVPVGGTVVGSGVLLSDMFAMSA